MHDRRLLKRAMVLGLLLTIAAFGNLSAARAEDPPVSVRDTANWKRVFTDDFDGEALNGKLWTKCYWWDNNGCTNLGAKELSWYMPENTTVSKGLLRLTARKETVKDPKGKAYRYTSGMVTTGPNYVELPKPARFEFQYGLIEISANIPVGKGYWPALWLLPSSMSSRPEIDLMEVLGDSTPLLRMHYHYVDHRGQKQSAGQTVTTSDLAKGFHVYGLRWDRDVLVWYIDGKEVWRYNDAATIPSDPLYLIMNLAVGGVYPGPPERKTKFPSDMLVDYVRIWQRATP